MTARFGQRVMSEESEESRVRLASCRGSGEARAREEDILTETRTRRKGAAPSRVGRLGPAGRNANTDTSAPLPSAVLQPCPSATGLASCPSCAGWGPNSRECYSSHTFTILIFSFQSGHRKLSQAVGRGPCTPFPLQLVTRYG
jgi:hypothetical protein